MKSHPNLEFQNRKKSEPIRLKLCRMRGKKFKIVQGNRFLIYGCENHSNRSEKCLKVFDFFLSLLIEKKYIKRAKTPNVGFD